MFGGKSLFRSGFTIVELLIVIVVIGILAAISIVAYNGIQGRARDTATLNSVESIIKALELYRVEHGRYPDESHFTNVQNFCTTEMAVGYGYSFANDGSWMKPLVDGGYIASAPVSQPNNCTTYIRYLSRPAGTSYNCTLDQSWYMIDVHGLSGAVKPEKSATFRPCPESTVTWQPNPNGTRWVFGKVAE